MGKMTSTSTSQARPSIELLAKGPGYVFTAHQNVLIASWTAQGTGPLIAALAAVLVEFVPRYPAGISSVHLIAAGLPLANSDAREALNAIMKQYSGMLACAGTVLDGDGFWASATRGMLVSLQFLAPSSNALRTCATVSELVAWLPKPHAERTGIVLEPKAFERAIADTRALSMVR
jgi:hypothetical protein